MGLSDVRIRAAKAAAQSYKLTDGAGMYLLVAPSGGRYWRFDYRLDGKRKTLALGVYPDVTLASARTRRDDARALLARNVDPALAKKITKRDAGMAKQNTFEEIARDWLVKQRNRLATRYYALLLARLEADVFPQIGSRPIGEVEAPELLSVLEKVQNRGAIETARRLRQICGQIFRYAIATGRAKSDPSAHLRGALRSPGRPRGHAAIPVTELPKFLKAVDGYDGDPRTKIALRLVILTFARTSELRGARWIEFENLDGDKPVWRIPPDRMKMKREHLVPLAPQAVSVLNELRALKGADSSPYLFPSPSRDGYMSNNTMLFALYRLGYHSRATVHGFRALASTVLNELGFRPDVIERQLAHQDRNAIRAAYNRAEYLSERREMMVRWAAYLADQGAKYVSELNFPRHPLTPSQQSGKKRGRLRKHVLSNSI